MTSINILGALMLERFRAKACPGLDPGWIPVRVKKTRQNKNLEPRPDSIGTEKALGRMAWVQIFWHILFLLRRHFRGVRLARNAPRTKQSSCHIVLAQARLAIVELAAASVT